MDNVNDFMCQIMGFGSAKEYREKQISEFSDYVHLLNTMSSEELGGEIAKRFSDDLHKMAILCFLSGRIDALREAK